MDDQLTLRVPSELAALLTKRAKAMGVKRSQVVRDALRAYLTEAAPVAPSTLRERIASYSGVVSLDHASAERDELARKLRAHNWRE